MYLYFVAGAAKAIEIEDKCISFSERCLWKGDTVLLQAVSCKLVVSSEFSPIADAAVVAE